MSAGDHQRPERSGSAEPVRSLLYRYFFFDWLFRDASRGTWLERESALRINRERRNYLLVYLRRWLVLLACSCALGASFENTVVLAEDRVLNPEGMRFSDEFVRHKVVDAIGDLALAGAPLLATYRTVRGGHKLNHAVLTALMADRSAWTYVEMPQPARRPRGHADLGTGLAAPAYGPDVS